MTTDKTDDSLPIKALIILVLFVVCLFAGVAVFNHVQSPILCGCGTHDSEIISEQEPEETAAKRKVRKIWFAGGSPIGMSEFQFQSDCMAGLDYLSTFTNTDFVKVDKSSGAYFKVYVFTNQQFWDKWASLDITKTVPGARQSGNSVWFTEHPRVVGWVGAFMVHEFGHRIGIKHSVDVTSIMHPKQPVKTLNESDRQQFIRKLGKKVSYRVRVNHRPLELAA